MKSREAFESHIQLDAPHTWPELDRRKPTEPSLECCRTGCRSCPIERLLKTTLQIPGREIQGLGSGRNPRDHFQCRVTSVCQRKTAAEGRVETLSAFLCRYLVALLDDVSVVVKRPCFSKDLHLHVPETAVGVQEGLDEMCLSESDIKKPAVIFQGTMNLAASVSESSLPSSPPPQGASAQGSLNNTCAVKLFCWDAPPSCTCWCCP